MQSFWCINNLHMLLVMHIECQCCRASQNAITPTRLLAEKRILTKLYISSPRMHCWRPRNITLRPKTTYRQPIWSTSALMVSYELYPFAVLSRQRPRKSGKGLSTQRYNFLSRLSDWRIRLFVTVQFLSVIGCMVNVAKRPLRSCT